MGAQKSIFITGITGNQGSAVAKYLLESGHSVIGLTRNSKSAKAIKWSERGVRIVEGDIDNPEAFKTEMNQADGVFLVQTLQGKQQEIDQGKRFIDTLDPGAGVHLVYSSVLGADLDSGIPHFESKFELEKHMASQGLAFSVLRPASFYENHLFPRTAQDIRKGKYVTPLNKNCSQQMIGVDDIGKIAARVFSKKDKYTGKVISIATDEWKIGDVPGVFSKALNIPVKYKKLPGLLARLFLGRDLFKMFSYMNKNDFHVIDDIQAVRDEFDIRGDLKSWVKEVFIPLTDPKS